MKTIAVIGGGASGIAASIQAARSGARVTLLEASPRIGRSILASGNGRCNWSNSGVSPRDYTNAEFVARAFRECSPQHVRQWFASLGLLWMEESEGRLYPQANKASSVLDVLRFSLDEVGVKVACSAPVQKVRPSKGAWDVRTEGGAQRYDAVIVCCGGGVAPTVVPDGYRFVPWQPRLCPMRTDTKPLRGLENARVKALVTLLDANGRERAAERGEVQFRPYGVSGIAVFNLSRFAQVGDLIRVNLLPAYDDGAVRQQLESRIDRFPARSAEQLLAGMVLPAVARAVLRQAGCRPEGPLERGQLNAVCRALQGFALTVRGFEEGNAQVRQGGFAVDQVDPATMEAARHRGLFVTGEALDVDGPCGGYNLHWAWTSGIVAGTAAAREVAHA